MDSYVVHIFRRPGQSGDSLVGLVERIGDGERKAFQNEAQLVGYLCTGRQVPGRSRTPRAGRSQK